MSAQFNGFLTRARGTSVARSASDAVRHVGSVGRVRGIALVLTCLSAGTVFSGCTALAIGGAAAGGYYVGTDERSARQIAEDGTITTAVKTKLIADKYVKAFDIDVDTYNAVVTLSGIVRSYVARGQAEELAKSVRGVQSVVNKIEVVLEE